MNGPLCMWCEKAEAIGAIAISFYQEHQQPRYAWACTSIVVCLECQTPIDKWDDLVMGAAQHLSDQTKTCVLVGIGSPPLPVRRIAELEARKKGWPLVICDRYGIGLVDLTQPEYLDVAAIAGSQERFLAQARGERLQ